MNFSFEYKLIHQERFIIYQYKCYLVIDNVADSIFIFSFKYLACGRLVSCGNKQQEDVRIEKEKLDFRCEMITPHVMLM